MAENIFLSVGVAGTGTGPTYPGGGATVLYTLDGDGKSTGFVVAGGGGGAGANGSGGNAAENTGQRGQDGSGSPGSGGSDEEPGLPDGQPKIQIGETPTDLPGQDGGGGGGLTGGGNGSTNGGGGGGGGSGTEGLTYMAVSYETADETGNGSVQIVTLPELKDDPDRDDATILYLIQPPLPSHRPAPTTARASSSLATASRPDWACRRSRHTPRSFSRRSTPRRSTTTSSASGSRRW